MKTIQFADSQRQVSRLGFGAMGLGGCFCDGITERDSIDSLLNAFEKGVNLVDSARGYKDSEVTIGKALKEWKGERPFITSKSFPLCDDSAFGIDTPIEKVFPKGQVTKSAEESLKAYDVDCIDLMQLHIYWPSWGLDNYAWDELEVLKEQGKIKYTGVSIPDHRSDLGLVLVQQRKVDAIQTIINIFDPLALDALVPLCKEQKVAILARCIFDESGLTGAINKDTKFSDDDFRKKLFESAPLDTYLEHLEPLQQYIGKYADNLAELALKFVIHDPGVTTALTSMHIKEYANQNIDAVNKDPLPDEIFDEIRRKHRWIKNLFHIYHF